MKWQRACQIRKSTHPWYLEQKDPEKVCNVCVTKFDVDPPKYEELVHGLSGNQVVAQIREGHMIVSTIEWSELSEAILLANNDSEYLSIYLDPWMWAVYLIIDISLEMRGRIVTAVNLTKELTRPPSYFQNFVRRFRHKKVHVKWMDSGPCEGLHGVGYLRATSRWHVEDESSLNVLHETPSGLTVAGAFEDVVEMCNKDWYNEKRSRERKSENVKSSSEPPLREVYACCGDGTWTQEQLIGEIVRGSWGLAPFKTNDVFKVPHKPEPPTPDEIFMMLQNENRPAVPLENEMQAFDEALNPTPFQDTMEARQHREELRAQLLSSSSSSPATISDATSPVSNMNIIIEAGPARIVTEESNEDMSLDLLPVE